MHALMLQTWRQLLDSSACSSSATRTQDLAHFLSYLLHLRGETASSFIETNGLDVTALPTPSVVSSLPTDQVREIRAVMQLQPTWHTFCSVDRLGSSAESKTMASVDETAVQKTKTLLASASVLQSQQIILDALAKSKLHGSKSSCKTSRRNSRVLEKVPSKGPSDSAIEVLSIPLCCCKRQVLIVAKRTWKRSRPAWTVSTLLALGNHFSMRHTVSTSNVSC